MRGDTERRFLQVNLRPEGSPTPAEQPLEVVERKGIAHPDTLCDGLAEHLAVELAAHYRRETGGLLHFNLDKILLSAGEVERGFGGGRIRKPITVYVGDRAALSHRGRDLGVLELIGARSHEWFRHLLPDLDIERGLHIVPILGPGSEELSALFGPKGAPAANDTSAAVGFAPLTPLEKGVRQLESWLNGEDFKHRFPATGRDVKIMAVRTEERVDVTIAMPFLSTRIAGLREYREQKDAVSRAALQRSSTLWGPGFDVSLALNALDDLEAGSEGVYLTLSGSSAEHGDSGEVGRGNKVHGLISLMRPGGAEAAAGKNPYCHVGKIYSALSFRLAEALVEECEEIRAAVVWMVSRIGAPIDLPRLIAVDLLPTRSIRRDDISPRVAECVTRHLGSLRDFCRELEEGKIPVF